VVLAGEVCEPPIMTDDFVRDFDVIKENPWKQQKY